MKVACPHCSVSYNVDDRRVPAGGLNVRCPKCRNTFPVRKEDAAAAAVPLPGPAAAPVPRAAPPPAAAPIPAVPLPGPAAHSAPAEGPRPAAAIRLPAPAVIAPPPPPLPPAAADPFATREPAFALDAPEPPAPAPMGEPAEPSDSAAQDPFGPALMDVAPGGSPAPEDAPSPGAPDAEPLGFGEVDFASAPPPAAPPPRPPAPAAAAAASPARPAPPDSPPPGEELEMLFGEGGAHKAPAPGGKAAYKVRRRSGKIFGPFEEAQIVEMLAKGELMGNEDVSPDDGGTWSPIGGVTAFAGALHKPEDAAAQRAPPRVMPFGDRMAGAKVVESGDEPRGRRWVKPAAAAAAVLLVLSAGAGAGFTRHGFFFVKAFRRGDAAGVAAALREARTQLQRAEYRADRAALDAVSSAVAKDPQGAEAAALHAMVVASLELVHGAPAGALDQARRAAERLDADEPGELPALAARLAVTLAGGAAGSTAAHEAALEQAAAKAAHDAETVALLARSALARGDVPRAATLFARLEALQPGTPRAGHGAGLALLARRDAAGARAAFEKVIAKDAGHLPSRVELAGIAAAAGDAPAAEAQLAIVLAEGADGSLAPAERARALAIRATILARVSAHAAEAERTFDAAVQADPRLVSARVLLASYRLRRGDAAAAVTTLDPVAAQAAADPTLAAVRIRALAAAGRALDASLLADQALVKSPGDVALLLAKGAALEAATKPDEAATIYQAAAARDPAAFEPRLALGRIALARRDLERARIELAVATEKGPKEPAAHGALGELRAAQGDAAGAEAAFQAALALDPEYAPAEIGLAKLALAKGDAAAARRRLERALAVDPRSAEGHVYLGTLLWKAKDLPAAERAFQAAVDLQPRNALALARLGAVKLERGEDLDGAVQRLTAASNEDVRLAEARQWLGRALLRKGEGPGAISQLRKAVALEPQNAEHHLHLGAALERSGALQEAVEEYRASAAADPRSAEAHERLATLFAANGRHDSAAAAYEKAIAAAPTVSRYRIALADCRARLGKHGEAARIYREVMKADPLAVQVFYKLARALHEGEGARAALPWYERAARDEKDNPMPHYYLGYLYKERGQKAKAAAEFKRFLALKPEADERRDIEAEIEDLGGHAP